MKKNVLIKLSEEDIIKFNFIIEANFTNKTNYIRSVINKEYDKLIEGSK